MNKKQKKIFFEVKEVRNYLISLGNDELPNDIKKSLGYEIIQNVLDYYDPIKSDNRIPYISDIRNYIRHNFDGKERKIVKKYYRAGGYDESPIYRFNAFYYKGEVCEAHIDGLGNFTYESENFNNRSYINAPIIEIYED